MNGNDRVDAGMMSLPPELQIVACPGYFATYYGTRAQLEDEGILPADVVWPTGENMVTWTDGQMDFKLRRSRPKGMRGPKKLWLEGDYWVLHFSRASESIFEADIRMKERALQQALYFDSDEARARRNDMWWAYVRARDDAQFQAFRQKLPALRDLAASRRSRRPA